MYCHTTFTRNFRNLKPQRLEWSMGLNLLVGENGSGKTNTLESLHILTGWGPFRSLRRSSLVNWNMEDEKALLKGYFLGEEHLEIFSSVSERTLMKCDGNRSNCSSIRERIPTLAFLPGDLSLIDGSPAGRRRYLDRICALIFPLYAGRLNDCKKTLRHRSVLLSQGKNVAITSRVLAPLVSWIWSSRRAALDLVSIGLDNFTDLLPAPLRLEHSRGGSIGIDDLHLDFWESIEASWGKEKIIKRPLVGPQRDDIIINSGTRSAAEYFSRGQRRRSAVAMMLAAAWAVERRIHRKPLLLLDEIAAELDEKGRNIMVGSLRDCGWQVFAATAENNITHWPGEVYEVISGEIQRKN